MVSVSGESNEEKNREAEMKCKECGGELETRLLPHKCSSSYPFSVCKNCGRLHNEKGEVVVTVHGNKVYCDKDKLVNK
jgi:uncharacterized Zn finger protein